MIEIATNNEQGQTELVPIPNQYSVPGGSSPTIGAQAIQGRNLLTVLGVTDVKAVASKLKTDAGRILLQPGDYITFTVSGIGRNKWEVAGINHYNAFSTGGNKLVYGTKNVVFMCSDFIANRKMHSSTNQHMYFGSELDTYLQGLAPAIEVALDVSLLSPLLLQSYSASNDLSGDWYWDPDDRLGYGDYSYSLASRKVYLPSIGELIGDMPQPWRNGGVQGPGNSMQFALTSMIPQKAVGDSTINQWQWTRSPARFSGNFYLLNQQGYGLSYGATFAGGVRPVFCL